MVSVRTIAGVLCACTLAVVAGCANSPSADGRGGQDVGGGATWYEGEDFGATSHLTGSGISNKPTASGGKALSGNAYRNRGDTVSYPVTLDTAGPVQVTFRYARLHWNPRMVPAKLAVSLTDPAGAVTSAEAVFTDTKGWGNKPGDWDVTQVTLSPGKAGPAMLNLTGTSDDNDVLIDGFWLGGSPPSADAVALNRVAITSGGYVGLVTSTTIRQDIDASVTVVASAADGNAAVRQVTLAAEGQPPVQLDRGVTDGDRVRYQLPRLPDGRYTLTIESANPAAVVSTPVTLAGDFLAHLEGELKRLEAFTEQLAKSDKPADRDRQAEFQHALEHLKLGADKLSATAALGRDARAEGLAQLEGIGEPAPILDDLRRTLTQYQETIKRLKANQDPYAGRTGDLRLAIRLPAGELMPYRLWIPSSYPTADKSPVILMLHGGGGNENYFPDLDGGITPRLADERGYVLICPRWRRRLPEGRNAAEELKLLVTHVERIFPRIDPARRYCTGVSMGGGGTAMMAATYPDLFAAACCVSGSGGAELAEKLKPIPMMVLHGGLDQVSPLANAQRNVERMKQAGGIVEFHVFPQNGHAYQPKEYFPLSTAFFAKHSREPAK